MVQHCAPRKPAARVDDDRGGPIRVDAFDAKTMYDAFAISVAAHPDRIALREREARSLTWRQWSDLVDRHRGALAKAGVEPGATVALLLDGGFDTYVFDMAVISAGGTAFSIYVTSSPEQIAHQVRTSEAVLLIAQSTRAEAARAAIGMVDRPVELWIVDSADEPVLDPEPIPAPAPRQPDDVATLIFTSGTTGDPKAAELTHGNVMEALRSSQAMVPLDDGCRLLSYLPPAHIADRVLAYYYSLATAATITIIPGGPKDFLVELPDARPEILLCVPRTWEVLQHAALEKAGELGIADFRDAIRRGVERVRAGEREVPAEDDRAVFAPVRRAMGIDDIKLSMSGSAPIPVETLEFFAAMGIWICEGYGLSETTGISVINRADGQRIGTIGLPAPGMEVKLSDEGELLIRGPLVMRGYRGNPEATAAALEPDGWIHSGDLATIDDEGYVRIVGRKKEILITSSGKNISPAQLEQAIIPNTDLIGAVVVVGDGRPHPMALVTLDEAAAVRRWPDLAGASRETLAADARVRAEIARAIDSGNERFSRAEQVRGFTILPDVWLPGSEEMTATLKLRRAPIVARYAQEIDAMYAGNRQPV